MDNGIFELLTGRDADPLLSFTTPVRLEGGYPLILNRRNRTEDGINSGV